MSSVYDKFNRNYILTIDAPSFSTPIVIALPFTMEFDIERNSYSSTNFASIKIYNLSKQHRNQIIHDQWDPSVEHTLYITLQAGYGVGPQFPIVFKGNATRAWSVRQGVDFITTIEAADGGTAFTNAVSNHTFGTNTPISQILTTLVNDLLPYGVSQGAVSNYLGTLAKGGAYSGSTIELLTTLSNGNFFIDNLIANVLLSTDAIGGSNVVLNSSSGLLGTPIKETQWLLVDMLFEPRLAIGTLIQLDSLTASNYNGPHAVKSIRHHGMISPAVCGDAITSVGLYAGVFNEVLSKAGL